MHDYNLPKKVDMFIKAAREQASQVRVFEFALKTILPLHLKYV